MARKGDEGLPFVPKGKRKPGMGDEGKPLKPGGKMMGMGDEGMPLMPPAPKVKKKTKKKTARGK